MTQPNLKVLVETIRQDLEIAKSLDLRSETKVSRSDKRRMVEDVIELQRYRDLHCDLLEVV
jgi:hypothetical protein